MRDKVLEPFVAIWKNRELAVELSKKEIKDKYKGQPLGMFWAFFHPFVLICIYIFLFGIVYKTRMETETQNTMTYASYLLSGMVPWLTIQSSLSNGSTSIIANAGFIKQVIFPIEVFPMKVVGAALIIESIYLVIDIIYGIIVSKTVLYTLVYLPFAVLIQIIGLIGINYILSALTVYLRDLKDIVVVLCQIGIYIMPVLYHPDAVPQIFKFVMYINPFSYYIWMFQDILYYGDILHGYSWIICSLFSLILLFGGHRIFYKLKVGFGSVL